MDGACHSDRLPPLRRQVAYVSGPYRGPTPAAIWQNIMRAREVAMDLWRMGYIALCPHTNTLLFDGLRPDEDWLQGDLELLRRCDIVVLVPGWRASRGAQAEVQEALRLGLPIYEWVTWGELKLLAGAETATATDVPLTDTRGGP